MLLQIALSVQGEQGTSTSTMRHERQGMLWHAEQHIYQDHLHTAFNSYTDVLTHVRHQRYCVPQAGEV